MKNASQQSTLCPLLLLVKPSKYSMWQVQDTAFSFFFFHTEKKKQYRSMCCPRWRRVYHVVVLLRRSPAKYVASVFTCDIYLYFHSPSRLFRIARRHPGRACTMPRCQTYGRRRKTNHRLYEIWLLTSLKN